MLTGHFLSRDKNDRYPLSRGRVTYQEVYLGVIMGYMGDNEGILVLMGYLGYNGAYMGDNEIFGVIMGYMGDNGVFG
jgi:hypothetical protein